MSFSWSCTCVLREPTQLFLGKGGNCGNGTFALHLVHLSACITYDNASFLEGNCSASLEGIGSACRERANSVTSPLRCLTMVTVIITMLLLAAREGENVSR